jgi:hypothetical protein
MEGNLQEAKTIPSISYVDRFFSELPNDARFGSVSWEKQTPTNGADRKLTTFDFLFPKMGAPNVYLVNKIFEINKLTFKINELQKIYVFFSFLGPSNVYSVNKNYPKITLLKKSISFKGFMIFNLF